MIIGGEKRIKIPEVLSRIGRSHKLMMGLCALAMGSVWVLPRLGVNLGIGSAVLLVGSCLGLHLVMMRSMHRHDDSKNANADSDGVSTTARRAPKSHA